MEASQAMVATGHPNGAGVVAREEFGSSQLEKRAETAATAMAAQAKAAIEARFVMALQRPRNMNNVRIRLLEECDSTWFAEQAMYAKPVGKKKNEQTGQWEEQFARGFSIRFAESAARHMGNLYINATTRYDDERTRILLVTCSDLETNYAVETDVVIAKTVERRNVKRGAVVVRQRVNSYGDPLFIVEATDDELLTKQNNLLAKARRNLILQMLSGGIQEEAKERIAATLADPKRNDPTKQRKKVMDAFATLNILPTDLEAYLGHPLDKATPAEIETLRGVWVSLSEGETTWSQLMSSKEIIDAPADAPSPAPATTPPKTTAELKARAKAEKKAKAAPAPEVEEKIKIKNDEGADITPQLFDFDPPEDNFDAPEGTREPGEDG